MKLNFYKILQENMRRFRTKNLTELDNLQTANSDPNADWQSTFRDFPRTTDATDLIMWWSDVAADMGSAVKLMAEKVEQGNTLADIRSELVNIMNHTTKCRDKIQMISPKVYNQIKDDVVILDMIKDDLVEEIKKLTTGTRFDEANSIVDQLEKIANSYVMVSEYLLEQSWDASDSDEEQIDTQYEKTAAAMASGVQDTRYAKPTGKTPWPSNDASYVKLLTKEQFYTLIRNKYIEGYSLKELFDWWMSVYPDASSYFGVIRIMYPLNGLIDNGIDTDDPPLISKKQENQFYDYIKKTDRARWNR